jgi:hypothetical protein
MSLSHREWGCLGAAMDVGLVSKVARKGVRIGG